MTSMKSWADKLSEPEIWKIVAYQRNFGLKGLIYDPTKDRWIDPASRGEDQQKKSEQKL
ncbi:MAG: hypothetical protein NPIRA01_03470 [Nitrospirales bacterium]|nr:MAG: hypothetical protein NPIRA01_03470 [Nitrospirales bacterium]